MINLWLFLKSGVGRVVAGAAAILAIIAGIRMDAKRDAKRDAEIKAARDAAKRRKDIQDAIENSHAGGGAWSERLREHD